MRTGKLPVWPHYARLRPDQELIHARDMSERPLHGVPSVWRDPNLEWVVNWFNGRFYIAENAEVPPEVAQRDKRVAILFQDIAGLADVIGFYTRRIRLDKTRTRVILRILEMAETPTYWDAHDYGSRAWMHDVCKEVVNVPYL